MALSDEQHAAIAAAWLDGRSWREVAADLGMTGVGDRGPSAAVRGFYTLVAHRGGWWHAVYFRTCPACAIQFATRHPDEVHAACRKPRINARHRALRASGPHPTSTDAVRQWRQQNPSRDLALRIGERFRQPAQRRTRTPEQKAAHSRRAIRSKQRVDGELRQLADQHGADWSVDEEAFLVDHQDWSATAVALEFGRTASSVQAHRRLLRKRGQLPPRGCEPVEVVIISSDRADRDG